jgi:MurNAc alpha-1-phosphate uridylyltransferase
VNVCAVVLAAGEGRRLRPLTLGTPKALCPVGNVSLLDRALDRMSGFDVAVNACYLAPQVVAAVGDRARLSVEPGQPLGTAGGLGLLKPWIGDRAVLAGNADAYLAGGDLAPLLAGWDGTTVRLLCVAGPPAEFSGQRFAGLSLIPPSFVAGLAPVPGDLVREVWRPAERRGLLEIVRYDGTYLDTGTPADYLRANLHAAAGGVLVAESAVVTGKLDNAVIGAGARVEGDVIRSVVWPGGVVAAGERLVDAVRVGADLTVPG